MNSLGSNPSGSGIFGMPAQENDNDTLSIVNRLKDREMQDYKDKANFNQDLQLRGEQRMRNLFDPSKHLNTQDMNHVMGPNILTSDQQIDKQHQLEQPQLDVEKQKIGQQNKFGQQALDIKAAQEKLNDTKNSQINQDRDADRDRKITEANAKIALAQQALSDRTASAESQLQAHKDMAAAVEERHKLEMAMKDNQFKVTSDQHQQRIKDLEDKLKQGQEKLDQGFNIQKVEEIDPKTGIKTTNIKRGDAAQTIQAIGKDGKTYTIPKDKLNDMDSDGTPHWKPIGDGVE